MKRKISALFILSLISMLLLSACGGGGQGGKKSDTVVIGVYGGDWEKHIKPSIESFEKDTGLKVKVVSGTDSEWFTKGVQWEESAVRPFDFAAGYDSKSSSSRTVAGDR